MNQREELLELLKSDKEFLVDITNKYKNLAEEGINSVFKLTLTEILNQTLVITYEIMKKMKKEDPLFKLMYMQHEKIYLFMQTNNLKISVNWEDDEFLKSVRYPLSTMEV